MCPNAMHTYDTTHNPFDDETSWRQNYDSREPKACLSVLFSYFYFSWLLSPGGPQKLIINVLSRKWR